jgi:murein DD-endopeptidase / murein LD-carboxypeptidase
LKLFYAFFIFISVFAFGQNTSAIVTSKKEAIKSGLYLIPNYNNTSFLDTNKNISDSIAKQISHETEKDIMFSKLEFYTPEAYEISEHKNLETKTDSLRALLSKKEEADILYAHLTEYTPASLEQTNDVLNDSINNRPVSVLKNNIVDMEETDIFLSGPVNEELAQNIIDFASNNMGVRYRSGGTSRAGFDCSGLVYTAFKSNEIDLPRDSFRMSKKGRVLKFHEISKGDLIFFKTRGSRVINHVGMVMSASEDEIIFIHSSSSKGVTISSTKEAYYGRAFAQVNRVVE